MKSEKKGRKPMLNEAAKKRPVITVLWETAGAFLCGLIFSCTQLGSIASPVPVAAASCTGPIGSAAVLLGALFAGSITQTLSEQIPLLISLMLAVSVRIILREYHSPRFIFISSSLCVLAGGIVVSFAQSKGGEGVLISVMSALLTGTTAYFLYTVLTSLDQQKKIHIRSSVGCAAAVVYFVVIAALSSFPLSIVNPGSIVGIAVTLIAAQRFRYTGGVICGSLTACGAMLSADELGLSLVFLPVTGLLAGYMSESGSFVTSGVFFIFNALAQLTIQSGNDVYTLIGNLLLGCITYLLLHTVCLDKWIVTDQLTESRIMENMAVRMQFMAESIGSVRTDAEKIADVLSHPANDNTICAKAASWVCSDCEKKGKCWSEDVKDTCHSMVRLKKAVVSENGSESKEFASCNRHDELCIALMKAHKQTSLQRARFVQKRESRKLISEQLIAAEDILSSAGSRMSVRYSSQLTDGIERRLDKYGYYCDSVAVYYNERERLMIELYCRDRQLEGCMSSVCHILTEMLNIELEELEPVGTKESVRYRLCQKPPFRLKQGSAARCAESGEVSGDTTVMFRDGDGCAYAVLSDGMGTGRSAAIESKMTAEMFRKLVSSGVSCDSALRIINGLMLTKSEQEGFATLDAARFDLDSGEITLIKSGASSTLLRQGDKVVRVCAPTFPIGAGASPDVFVRQFPLKSNDMIVMLSDGVLESQYPFIKELLMKSDDPVFVAEEICRKAVIFSGGRCRDDISVSVIQILETERASI